MGRAEIYSRSPARPSQHHSSILKRSVPHRYDIITPIAQHLHRHGHGRARCASGTLDRSKKKRLRHLSLFHVTVHDVLKLKGSDACQLKGNLAIPSESVSGCSSLRHPIILCKCKREQRVPHGIELQKAKSPFAWEHSKHFEVEPEDPPAFPPPHISPSPRPAVRQRDYNDLPTHQNTPLFRERVRYLLPINCYLTVNFTSTKNPHCLIARTRVRNCIQDAGCESQATSFTTSTKAISPTPSLAS